MKESTFIELLNLYIDQQISPEDAARLEEEIQVSPRRRRVYRQYCQMHRACTLVLENYAANAETAPLLEFKEPARRFALGYLAAGLAAAAVAVVAAQVYWHPATASGRPAPSPVAAAPAPTDAVVAVPVRLNVPLPASQRLPDGAAADQPLLLRLPAYGSSAAALARFDTPSIRVPLRTLSIAANPRPASSAAIEQFVFQSGAPVLDNPQTYRIRRPADGQAEMTAYQFQR